MAVRQVAVIVVTAVTTASGLARVAFGLDTAARSVLAPAPSAVPAAAPAVAAASTPVPREDVEPEEPHLAGTVENPYEEPKEARAAYSRQTVPARDGMLRLPGGRFVMGSSSSRAPVNEHPTRTVVVAPF